MGFGSCIWQRALERGNTGVAAIACKSQGWLQFHNDGGKLGLCLGEMKTCIALV